MDSFSYYLQDIRPLLLDNMDFPVNTLGKSNNHVKDSAFKSVYDSDKTLLVLDGEIVGGGTEIVESAFPHMVGEFVLGNSVSTNSVFNIDQLITQDLGFGIGSELSDSGYNYSDKKEILVESEICKVSSRESMVSSLVEDSLQTKRGQTTNIHSQIPLCQVQGCYKDLSSSKDYHKRHRVCGVHAKSAKVVIKGIEKRFCQQCSRFHLLKEFDDVKRSCRKRLAGHNERRRKPHIGSHIGADSNLLEMDLLKSASFFLTEEHPSSFFYQEKYADDNQSKRMRLEKVPGAGASAGEVEFPMPLGYGCAPSLLSFNSKFSSNSPEMAVLNPENIGSSPAYGTADNKFSTLNSFIQIDHFPTCTGNQKDPILYYKDCNTLEAGQTLDLLHLSSHLRRVEKLQNSVQVKQEM